MSAEYDEKLNTMIQDEIDRLFTLDHFDERDLVAVDIKVREYLKKPSEKLTKKVQD
jgi:hypothetical protein